MRNNLTVRFFRRDLVTLLPRDELNLKWQKVIRRLELISLAFYFSLLFMNLFLFFYHDWYCSIGHNPCGPQNLKCPWMKVDPSNPVCQA